MESTSLPNATFSVPSLTPRLSEPVPSGGLAGPERSVAVGEPIVLRSMMPQLPALGAGADEPWIDGPVAPVAPVAPVSPLSPLAPVAPGLPDFLTSFWRAGERRSSVI